MHLCSWHALVFLAYTRCRCILIIVLITVHVYHDCMLSCYALHLMHHAKLASSRHSSRFLLNACDAELQKLQRLL